MTMTISEEYPIHPLAYLSRDRTAEEQAELVEGIRIHGQLVAILRLRREVIDGRHRLAACLEVGVEPRFEDLDDDADPGEIILALVGKQRRMTPSQLSLYGVELSRWSNRGRPRAEDDNCVNLRIITQERAADALGISRSLITHANRLVSADSTAAPELVQAVKNGAVQVTDASKAANQPLEVQRAAVEMVVKGEAKTISSALRKIQTEAVLQEDSRAMETARALPVGHRATLHAASVEDMETLVDAASLDAIITHPPHDDRLLARYSSLAYFAAHALRESGVLVVVGSSTLLPKMLQSLDHPDLRWAAEFDLVFQGAADNSGPPHFMKLHRRSLLVYRKANYRINDMHDLVKVPPPNSLPPGCHRNEAAMTRIVEHFVRPGQVVCDPWMLDRSGVALGALQHGCFFRGATERPEHVGLIRSRLERWAGPPTSETEVAPGRRRRTVLTKSGCENGYGGPGISIPGSTLGISLLQWIPVGTPLLCYRRCKN